MKARDLIPGWPRGRSCSRPFDQDHGGYVAWWMTYRMRDPFEKMKLQAEIGADLEYRQEQQTMVDKWRNDEAKVFALANDAVRRVVAGEAWEVRHVPEEKVAAGYYTYRLHLEAIEVVKPKESKEEADQLLFSAYHALRSYEYGNSATDLAKECADAILEYRTKHGPKYGPNGLLDWG